MKISHLRTEKNEKTFRVLMTVERGTERRDCFFEVAAADADKVDTISCDCFLLSFLMVAMYYGEDLHVDGMVSARLLLNLNQEIVPLLNAFNPTYKLIRLTAEKQYEQALFHGTDVGTGFSGGVDSFFTYLNNFVNPMLAERKITCSFFFNVGSHGVSSKPEDLKRIHAQFDSRYELLSTYPKQIGIPYIRLDSNLHSFYPVGHLESCTFVTCAAAMLFQKMLRSYLLSSGGWNYRDKMCMLKTEDHSDPSMLDPALLPYFETENLRFAAVETRYSRFEKLRALAEYEPARRYLNVCYRHDEHAENCSVCIKCGITLLMLDILGKQELFAESFHLNRYKTAEKQLIAKILTHPNEDPYYADICERAKEYHYDLRSRTSLLYLLSAQFGESKLFRFVRCLPGVKAIAGILLKH